MLNKQLELTPGHALSAQVPTMNADPQKIGLYRLTNLTIYEVDEAEDSPDSTPGSLLIG